MYLRFAERHRMSAEVIHAEENGIGGIGEAIVEIDGRAPTAASSSRPASTASSASP
jgi:protein subunit release factor A